MYTFLPPWEKAEHVTVLFKYLKFREADGEAEVLPQKCTITIPTFLIWNTTFIMS